ncbi:ESPR-type extended signal peptide-containing protein, partial [Haemophilus parahaemolyticus]|uniref:ESPR-type extended signal peptide-containing protein n=1 Tax=Haemophilus parahaemolyticus TaxID=735 RepID=UPI0028EA6A79
MNKIFKVIWNKTTQRLEVVSELAKGAVKSSSNNAVNLAKDLSKPVLKLSLLSICLGYPTWAMAATGAENGAVKYGDYGIAIGGYNGGAQVGPKPKEGNRVAAVGNRQISIGHDKLVASGNNSIVIGSDYGHANAWGLTYRQGGTQGFNTVGIGAGAQSIGLNALALGAASGSGVGYQGYDDAVYLGSFSRIAPKGLGQNYTDAEINNLNNTYVTAVEAFNQNQNADTLNAVKEAGRKINNAALNKVEGMTIKSNVVHPTQTGKFTTQDQQVSQINGSAGTTTVSILSVGGKDGNNTMYRQIQNVAAGRIASDSNDAVTGSQLYYVRNYTGWNIGHYDDVTRANTTTGRVNNDHTVIFKPGNYTDVWTSLDSTNRSTVNIEVKTANLGTEVANGKISKITVTDPISTDANNTVARTAGVKSVLDKFNEIKADKVDIMGYSHVNETDANNVTENRIITAKNWENQFDNNNGTYHESAGAKGNRAITSGVRANALAKDSIAIGSLANVNNNWGSQLVAAERSIAIGREATVNAGQDSIAMGSGAQILHNDQTTLNANNAIAIGKLAKVDQASNAIALGNNASIGGNYASNGVWKASDNSIAIGNNTTVSRENSVGIGTNVSVARENSVVIGQEAKATQERVVAIGAYATANGDRTVAIGPEATANGSKSIVIGGLGDNQTDKQAKSEAGATQAIVIGNGAQAKAAASYSITLGNSAKTEAATGISIGDRANVASGANNGIALGQAAVANNSGDIAIGQSSSTSTKHTVNGLKIGDATLSTGVAATDNGTVSFGKDNVKRQIQNVGAGEISATSSDVITGSQLYHVIKAADEIAKTEYNFQVNGKNIKTMRNNGTSAANNAHNTLNFKAGDGLDVTYENNAVTYKLNDDSKQAITDAKTAAQTVTTKLNQIDQSVQRAETAATSATTAATNAASSATVASTAAKVAISSASAANSSATAASTSASAA